MKKIPYVSTYMTPTPITVSFSVTLAVAKAMMEENKIRHLPVTNGKKLVGVLSDRDIRLGLSIGDLETLRVEQFMTSKPFTVNQTTDLAEVLASMAKEKIGSAIVLNTKEEVVGIFTTIDAARVFSDILRSMASGTDTVSDLEKILHHNAGSGPRWRS
jgi:acetoin utilization protein AcuB